ncbi:hypothetical protein LTR36_002845 [Oleoguttula mirabilis]|uniref:Uncharacterized protein n=1 Tax=Oleoguttula mirabilis TaxID=1507867 RepID=A0AAV9JJU7_9PEZI|nr:hypothetical protein LTR36_002845 [Oleoguttula mirabilis]
MLVLLSILALLSIALAAPTPTNAASATTTTCHALIEQTPWTISNLTAFDAAPGYNGSYVSFHFCDVNDGLELETDCSRYLPKGSSRSPIDPATYYDCGSNEVRFIYAGSSLIIERSFVDDCLGPVPYNSAIAYGTEDTNVANTTSLAGDTCTQAEMFVKITKES